ncbi:hypothetical protein LL037_18715 [Clostridium estertheticum]|uniref:hypothetical protein n=1 Tax=Clostridium estertheticum TaxID=238834 RepID=UPI001C0B28C7|nr:hypothetical protein [Clostridium estertheticum]MBU3200315.1 hypothetical protein [Clostridium estertheticum]WAG64484.1 hypothetical protein LL037_18715 [Clostridium estertheticum]
MDKLETVNPTLLITNYTNESYVLKTNFTNQSLYQSKKLNVYVIDGKNEEEINLYFQSIEIYKFKGIL